MSGDPGETNTDPFTHLLPATRAAGVYTAYAAAFLTAATLVPTDANCDSHCSASSRGH